MNSGDGNFWKNGSVPLIEPEFLGSIISAASDIALVVSADGVILSVVLSSSDDTFGNLSHWEGRPLSEFLTSESIEKFDAAHAAYLEGLLPKRPVELNHSDNAVWQYPVRYTFHRFGYENAVLLLGRDLRPIAETQQQLVQAQIALEQGYEARREFDARYRVMLNNVSEAVLFTAVGTGRVEDANGRAAILLGLKPEALAGAGFASLFSDRSGAELTEALIAATLADDVQPVLARAARTRNMLAIQPSLFRAGGQRVLMCRLSPAEEIEGTVVRNDAMSAHALSLFRSGSDAMVFTDDKGGVLSVNDAFLNLIGAAHTSDVTNKSFGDFMARGQIDLGLMLGGAATAGHMKIYATRLVDQLGTKLPVEISLTVIDGENGGLMGLVIRDASRLEPVRGGSGDPTAGLPDKGHKVVELVGSATLKEIVAETTDVVEKMCIETAVNLTRNNRVAAAEMLGLSRQSLYVKLRKFGLLRKDA